MPLMKLTQDSVKQLTSDDPRGIRWTDTEVSGFFVTVYANGRKVYGLRYGPRNRRRFVTIGEAHILTAGQARQAATKILAAHRLQMVDVAREIDRERDVPTFREWVETYMEDRREQRKSANREASYLEDACTHFGGTALDEVTQTDIKTARKAIRKRGRVTANRWLSAVRACLHAAEAEGLIMRNVAKFVEMDRETPRPRRTLTDAELKRLIRHIDEAPDMWVRAALLLLIGTGFRKNEVLRARWADVDLERGLWHLPDTKSGKPQTVPIAPAVVDLLRSLPRRMDSPWVIPSMGNSGKPRAAIEEAWGEIRKRASLEDIWIHDLRGVFADRINRVADLQVAAELLRHANIQTTADKYAPVAETRMRTALEKVVGDVIPFPTDHERG
jgi:integrase